MGGIEVVWFRGGQGEVLRWFSPPFGRGRGDKRGNTAEQLRLRDGRARLEHAISISGRLGQVATAKASYADLYMPSVR
jgi:hypothetical protein